MLNKGFFIYAAFAALAFASEIEDGEQKKRGAGKANILNAIPTGPQKTEYTYNIYSQNPSSQSNPSHYQNQVPNSFYPNQVASQYFTPSNNADQSSSPLHTQVSPQITAQPVQSHFVPINVYPNPSYQPKYQILSAKPSGNLQLAIMQPTYQASPIYPHTILSPSHTNQIPFNFQTFQPLSLGNSFIGHPSMVVLPQTHASLYNNLVYPNPTQSFYNYYPSTSQAKYNYGSVPSVTQSNDYDKTQSFVPQSVTKDDNSGVQSTEYINPNDSISGYKNAYSSGTAYSKL